MEEVARKERLEDPTQTQDVGSEDEPSSAEPERNETRARKGCCCRWAHFDGNTTAQGYNLHGLGRGPIYMASLFLATSLIFLASKEVGCIEVNEDTGKEVIVADCDERVYGVFRPAALVTNIATIAGVLVALVLPIIGAILDYTPHRWTVGVVSAALLVLIEAIQIGTTSDTWFAMGILEAVNFCVFEVQFLAIIAYLPDIARDVGEKTMSTNTAYFFGVEKACQLIFVIIIVALAMFLDLNDVTTSQVAQGLTVVWSGLGFFLGWRLMPKVPAARDQIRHKRAKQNSSDTEGEDMDQTANETQQPTSEATNPQKTPNILLAGFVQNWNTFKQINREYKNSLRWFLLACIFSEAAATAFGSVAIVFLTDHLGLDATQIGVFFLISLVASIISCWLGSVVTKKTNPNISWRLVMLYLMTVSLVGAFSLSRDTPMAYAYLWGFGIGLGMGWNYQVQYVYIGMVTPKGQEAELAGFFDYCRLILVWLPPLLFSLLVEANVSQKVGVAVISLFNVVAIAMLSLSAPWEQVLEEVHRPIG